MSINYKMQAMQVIQKLPRLPRQAIAVGAIPLVIEEITFISAIVEMNPPPFCPICEKYILKSSCSNTKYSNNCPMTKK